jgi:phage terminase large subunit-like protein
LAGRGFGKSRSGAEWVRKKAAQRGPTGRIALVARTAADVRDVMIEGESGILATAPPWFRPIWKPSTRRLVWPNGCLGMTYSAEEPDLLRGPQHTDAWADEVAAWQYDDTWDQLEFGLRLGDSPQCLATTTPKPTKLIKQILADADTVVTRGSTFENKANLAKSFVKAILRKYEGTRLGRQELYAEILDDAPGALWKRAKLDANRVKAPPRLGRVVVAIDPAVTSGEDSDETGIIVAGLGYDDPTQAYILEDVSGRYAPTEWARVAVKAYREHGADCIVGEVNNGGDLVETTIRAVDRDLRFKAVRASRGKHIRFEPVAALDEQGRIHHVGTLGTLEDQQCSWEPGSSAKSPDRVDARAWAITELMLGASDSDGSYSSTIVQLS